MSLKVGMPMKGYKEYLLLDGAAKMCPILERGIYYIYKYTCINICIYKINE